MAVEIAKPHTPSTVYPSSSPSASSATLAMKLTLRREWQLRPLSTFVWFIDIKTGVKIVLLCAVLNKVAGLYGLIAVLLGAGGNFLQISMYLYSVLGLGAYAWGLKAVAEESLTKSMTTAHVFLVDHLVSTVWTVMFGIDWWVYNPHDGQRPALSPPQQEIADVGPGKRPDMTPEELLEAAHGIWNQEKGSAAAVLFIGWMLKFYFAALIYSYAVHLRKGTYRSLALTHAASHSHRAAANGADYHPLYENELDDRPELEADGMWDVRTPMDSHGDIDFDADDWDGPQHAGDIERGRRSRGVGQVLSAGEYAGEQPSLKAGGGRVPNGGGPRRVVSPRTTSDLTGTTVQVSANDSRQRGTASRPTSAATSPRPPQPSRTLSQTAGSPTKSEKEKLRAREIQRELEQSGAPGASDWDDEGDAAT